MTKTAKNERVAVVTGAGGGGIGTSTALALAAQGYAVCVHGRVLGRLEPITRSIVEQGGAAISLATDLADPTSADELILHVRERLGPVSALVHNAADGVPHRPLEDLTLAEWRRDQAVILEAAFILSARALIQMRRQCFGRIVFVSSSAALRGSFGRSACYAAAKAGLIGLAKQIAIEYGPFGVTANVVAPSQIDTPRIRKDARRTEAQLTARGTGIPLRRVGRAQDVAGAIGFLCSDAGSYLTGTVLPIDGGSQLAGAETKAMQIGTVQPDSSDLHRI